MIPSPTGEPTTFHRRLPVTLNVGPIVRMLDLALGLGQAGQSLFLVAPDARETDVREQLRRPAFSRVADLDVRFIAYGELAKHREAIARFGHGLKPVEAIARRLS